MAVARTWSVALAGLTGSIVEVEASASATVPGMAIVGLPDKSLGEAAHRIKSATANSGCPLPGGKLTINLSPASLPKQGSAFDLSIAIACLAVGGLVRRESAERVVHLGELGLDGRLRPLSGVLPAVLAVARAGYDAVMVPTANVAEAQLVPGVTVVGATSLRDAAIWHGAELTPIDLEPVRQRIEKLPEPDPLDLADVVGQPDAVDAMVAAAAGGHHVMMVGPPGAGKTMLAARLPEILPDLGPDAAVEVSCLRSLIGLPPDGGLVRRPPWESPHHSSSAAAIIGGGSRQIRPGAAARAAHGVLFLDEAPEFRADVLDSLRQPLESGVVTVHRAHGSATFPAAFQLVLAANPCPCGQYGTADGVCTCPPQARRRYLGRVSGPLLDRIDIRVRVQRITSALSGLSQEGGLSTAEARARVEAVRSASAERLAGTGWTTNAQASGTWLRSPRMRLARSVTAALDRSLERGGITMRGYDRILRLAWTLADLDGADSPTAEHLGRALFLRKGIS
ncbi:YifB family Mg chelatase-like AAA ATPase [Plantibacter sp. VKM Ac-2880]|uniref:YifB family Mg chelatase-like AAA ATPase n=1 Tax=Plantibacter sp. VKM Ac-2880 TaxID=2783827 RepID=UPI00188FDB19|nr:YifB family Mg chelatase-like AAA ATPase [Plantibacter sp. VKM Ac-2880]MBF4568893.1 YifB family Mg chelatase-like AAA ATPase [Plantibacter sp. VKM Ac-2880]